MLHHVTDWYRLLVTGSGAESSSAPASLQIASTIERSTLQARSHFTVSHLQLLWERGNIARAGLSIDRS